MHCRSYALRAFGRHFTTSPFPEHVAENTYNDSGVLARDLFGLDTKLTCLELGQHIFT